MRQEKTRRTALRALGAVLAGSFFGGGFRRSQAAALWQAPAQSRALFDDFRRQQTLERRYRADAAVTLGGITIFTRRGVGGALATVELGNCGGSSALALSFIAGSDPSRCAGLNRFGILQEAVVEGASVPAFAFAGLITDNKEEDLEQARQALRSGAAQQLRMARGGAQDGHIQAWTDMIGLAQPCTWRESADLLEKLSQDPPKAPVREFEADAGPFLSVYLKTALRPEEVSTTPFLHAGKLYRLELRRRPKGERDGLIRDQHDAKIADFRVFEDPNDASGLPARIEYRAKSYLKLIFEADGHVERPNLKPLFTKEAI